VTELCRCGAPLDTDGVCSAIGRVERITQGLRAAGGLTSVHFERVLEEGDPAIPLRDAVPAVSTRRGGLRFGQPPPRYVPPKPEPVHEVTLYATPDRAETIATIQVRCSCGEILLDQDDDGPLNLGEVNLLVREHTGEVLDDDDW
jgi:hypothetical protein